MTISPGDRFSIVRNGKKLEVQVMISHDRGETWLCSRTDGHVSETAFVVSAEELQQADEDR